MSKDYGSKLLKAPKGFMIEKSWELHSVTGKVKPDTIVYTVYTGDGEGLIDSFATLKEAQECCKRESWRVL